MEDPYIWRLLLLASLIAINAVFTMTEIAVISLNDNKVRRMADEGDEKAKRIAALLERPSDFFSSMQIMVTLACFLASAIAASGFATPLAVFIANLAGFEYTRTAGNVSLLIITVVLSFITLVFGEIVPKQVGMRKAERVAYGMSGVISLLGKLLKPFIALLTLTSNAILRLMGIDPRMQPERVTEEEILMMVDLGEEKGAIAADEKELITNVFEFNNKQAADVMTHRTDLSMIYIDDDPGVIRDMILETGYTRFPVYDEDTDDIIGVLHLRDYFANSLSDHPAPLRDLLRPAYFIPEHVAADALFRDMQKEKIHFAVVVDEFGGTRGVVTMEDLVEEIVGNIYDEHDEAPDTIQRVDETTWRVPGSAELESLEEIFDVRLPQDEFYTLGGLVFSQLRSIPEDGSTPRVEAYGLLVEVEEVLDHRVEWARVSKISDKAEDSEKSPEDEDARERDTIVNGERT